jgi:carboxymethylenebutenolidase
MAETVTLTGHGGDPVRAEVFAPAGAARAGVVVAHEVFGLDAFARSVGERLAAAGLLAVAPDLYSRAGCPGPVSDAGDPAPEWTPAQIRAAVAELPDRRAVADLDGAARWLLEERAAGKVGVVGFCMGGNLAYLLGCHSTRVAAVVDFYGRVRYDELSREKPVQPLEMALNLDAPLLAFFGERDASIPLEDVAALSTRLDAFAKNADVRVVSEVGHGFFNHLRPAWHAERAAEVWEETVSFLMDNLT